MNSIKLRLTAQTPFRFGMPISGHAFGATTPATDARTTTVVVRERAVIAATKGGVMGDMGLAQSYFPGTSAWSPPIC